MEQKIIGKNIAKFRKERNLTQTQLADFLFITPQTVSKWEAGNGTPDISLIPKIALFLQVSIDELFGITNMDQVEDQVLRYSVVRQENQYEEALKSLDHKLDNISAEKDSAQKEYYRLQGLKTHLFLQNSRDKIQKGIQLAQEMLAEMGEDYENEWYLPTKLQLTLFRYMNGDCREIYEEHKTWFETEPSVVSLYVLCETLIMLEYYEEIVRLLNEDNKAVELVTTPNAENKKIYIQWLAAAAELQDASTVERLAKQLLEICDTSEQFEVQWTIVAMYQGIGETEKVEQMKLRLIELLEQLDEKEYIKEVYREQIMAM